LRFFALGSKILTFLPFPLSSIGLAAALPFLRLHPAKKQKTQKISFVFLRFPVDFLYFR